MKLEAMICLRGRRRNLRIIVCAASLLGFLLWNIQHRTIVRDRTLDVEDIQVVHDNHAADNITPKSNDLLADGILHEHVDKIKRKGCEPRVNFVYIKEIKCASQTLTGIFRRFGYNRNLSFVIPVEKRLYLGWPYLIEKDYYRPTKTGMYNILCEHSVFDDTRMRGIMPPDTIYITGVREPLSQFISMFNYYNFINIIGLSGFKNPIREYLSNIDVHEKTYIAHYSSKLRYCVPDGFSMSRNLMSYVLGFPTGFLSGQSDKTSDDVSISDWLTKLKHKFKLVMITEYFHESLILLKRLMCWDFQDIIYLNQNKGVYGYETDIDAELLDVYRKHSSVDYRLYDTFNKTFWDKIASLGSDFKDEVRHFGNVNDDVTKFCADVVLGTVAKDEVLQMPPSRWSKGFVLKRDTCEMMAENILYLLRKDYDSMTPQLDQPTTTVQFC